MKIATITLFCNEGFRLEAWKQYYSEYRDDIALHVIVNNGNPSDTALLQESFPDSMVLESDSPNMMYSYNLALREILKDQDIDAIAQIVNDIRIEKGGIRRLWEMLFSREEFFAVSPILLRKDSEKIDCFGCRIKRENYRLIHLDVDRSLEDVPLEVRMVDGLPAGIILAKRCHYERLGFQDESIYMYADEIDMGLKVAGEGFKMVATSFVKAWHQHQFKVASAGTHANPRAAYYIGRNAVYLARKYESAFRVARVFLHHVIGGMDVWRSAVFHNRKDGSYAFGWAMIKGAFNGLIYR